MKIRRGGFTHRALRRLREHARAVAHESAMLDFAIGHAYEGMVICDPDGIVVKTNEAYARFLGCKVEDLVGRHVTEVIENTRMHVVAKTGVAEIAQLQKVRGHEMVCSRIPIFEDGKLVAVVGKIMFRDVGDLFAMSSRFANLKKELEFYKSELSKRIGARYSFENIVGASAELERAKELGRRVARSDTTVLLCGESGTGKELFAHAIHVESARALAPFVKVNCAAIPETLFESELFGYKAGAFTGAQKTGKKGKFALANGGTLFLDEVSEIPLTMQVKLLRVLQEREIEPVGSEQTEAVDVRIVAATNRELEELIDEGAFRRDLFYRLNVVRLDVPALRTRRSDIPILAEKLLRQLEKETGIPVEGVEPAAMAALEAYAWPGNVRELRNVLEQALYLKAANVVTHADLPRAITDAHAPRPEPQSLKDVLHQTEEQMIRKALRDAAGDKAVAASRLGISKSSIYAKLQQYRIAE
jgi:PAS domain S-box-containing protein